MSEKIENKLIEKLDQIREDLGISRAELSRRLVGGPSMFTDFKSGRKKSLGQVTIKKLSQEFGINVDWLINDTGPMYTKDRSNENPPGFFEFDLNAKIPVYSGALPASPPGYVDDSYEWQTLKEFFQTGDESFGIHIRGDSMMGAGIQDGDDLVVDRNRSAEEDDVVVVRIDGEWSCKHWRPRGDRIILTPNGEGHDEIRRAKQSHPDSLN